MTTGEMIKTLLDKKKKSQVELANYLGVKPNTVNRWIPTENKQGSEPAGKFLPMIADFFNISVEVLIGHDSSWDSRFQHPFSPKSVTKAECFTAFLEQMGYSITPYTQDECSISWTDKDGYTEERIMKYVELEFLLLKTEKHIGIEIENYYEKW